MCIRTMLIGVNRSIQFVTSSNKEVLGNKKLGILQSIKTYNFPYINNEYINWDSLRFKTPFENDSKYLNLLDTKMHSSFSLPSFRKTEPPLLKTWNDLVSSFNIRNFNDVFPKFLITCFKDQLVK